MSFELFFTNTKELLEDIYILLTNFITESVYIYLLILLVFSICLNIYLYIGQKKIVIPLDTTQYSEYIKMNYKLKISDFSPNIESILNINIKNDLNSLDKITEIEPELIRLIQTSIEYKHSFYYLFKNLPLKCAVNYDNLHITIFFEINYKILFESLPIPVSAEIGKKIISNKVLDNFGNLITFNFLFKGEFFEKGDIIFRKDSLTKHSVKYLCLFPIMTKDEYEEIINKQYDLPNLSMCLMSREGRVIKIDNKFMNLFELQEKPKTFQCFLEQIRNYILHNEVFFANFKKYFTSLFNNLNGIVEENHTTINGKVVQFKFVPTSNNNIVLICDDITKLSIDKTKEEILLQCKDKIFPLVSDFMIFINDQNKVDFSNCKLIQIGENISTVRTILKFFTTPDNGIQEINLANNTKCLFVKASVKDKIFKVKLFIENYLNKIMKILHLLNKTVDNSLDEYLKYIQFIIVKIENSIKTLEVGINKNYECTTFDIIKEFNSIKTRLEEFIEFKNLNIKIEHDSLEVFNHQESISLLLEQVLLIAFKYQFNHKNLTIEEKHNKIYINLDGINKEEVDKIYTLFDLINNIHIFSDIKEFGTKISVGFHFEKISHYNI